MAAKWLRIAVPGVVVAVGATGAFLSEGKKNCRDLVKTSNAVVDASNNAKTDADLTSLMPRMKIAAQTMRTDANDYGSPFDTDARDAATALDGMESAMEKRDVSSFKMAMVAFNAVVDRTNKDCDKA